jgi:hypothetical protein
MKQIEKVGETLAKAYIGKKVVVYTTDCENHANMSCTTRKPAAVISRRVVAKVVSIGSSRRNYDLRLEIDGHLIQVFLP